MWKTDFFTYYDNNARVICGHNRTMIHWFDVRSHWKIVTLDTVQVQRHPQMNDFCPLSVTEPIGFGQKLSQHPVRHARWAVHGVTRRHTFPVRLPGTYHCLQASCPPSASSPRVWDSPQRHSSGSRCHLPWPPHTVGVYLWMWVGLYGQEFMSANESPREQMKYNYSPLASLANHGSSLPALSLAETDVTSNCIGQGSTCSTELTFNQLSELKDLGHIWHHILTQYILTFFRSLLLDY